MGGSTLVGLVLLRMVVGLVPHASLSRFAPSSTAVTARDGTLLRLTLADDGQYRLWTALEQISPALVQATLLYEDRHFFRHPGFDPVALVRAAFTTYLSGSRRVGGSTITMQLARRLWSIPSQTPLGKLTQLARALQLEAQYSKRELLEAYLNLAPYGGNIEGVAAASEIYFRKPPAKLTLAEALTLAVIPQSPTRRSRDGRLAQKDADADAATDSGALERARQSLWATWRERRRPGDAPADAPASGGVRHWPRLRPTDGLPFRAPHFVDQILTQAANAPDAAKEADAARPSHVRTSLDARAQGLLERHVAAYLARHRDHGLHNAAALLVDTRDMAVRALVGSADFFSDELSGQVNGTLAPRSPGSALKPFAYALGLDQGVIHPATMLRDVPTSFAAYSPENFDGRFAGPLSAEQALIRSRNVPALAVAGQLAHPDLYELLRQAGVDLPFPESHYGLGLVLGTAEVTMQDLARLYGALASDGVLRPLRWFDDATPAPSATGVRLFSSEAAYLTLDMLANNPRPDARALVPSPKDVLPVAWKTGTSWGFRDAWAVGVFGAYVLAVWVGNFSGEGNPAFVGATAAGPLMFEIIDSLAATDALARWSPRRVPAGLRRVEVCALSGGLPTRHCPHRRTTWFIPGRSPADPCAIHRELALDADGRRTCPSGPPVSRREVFELWPSDLAKLFAAAGLPRRPLPEAAPGCGDADVAPGVPPRITSPLLGVTYRLPPNPPSRVATGEAIALQAVTDGDAGELFWFADQTFLGKAPRGTTLFWHPPAAGRFTVRAVDELGRADTRAVAVEVVR